MNLTIPVKAGLVLGGLVMLWQAVSVGFGLDAVFPLVATVIELVVLLGCLALTRGQSGPQQVGAGVLATLVALPLVVVGYLLSVMVVFPGAVPDDQVIGQGVAGVLGTLVTGVLVSVVGALFLRGRGA